MVLRFYWNVGKPTNYSIALHPTSSDRHRSYGFCCQRGKEGHGDLVIPVFVPRLSVANPEGKNRLPALNFSYLKIFRLKWRFIATWSILIVSCRCFTIFKKFWFHFFKSETAGRHKMLFNHSAAFFLSAGVTGLKLLGVCIDLIARLLKNSFSPSLLL